MEEITRARIWFFIKVWILRIALSAQLPAEKFVVRSASWIVVILDLKLLLYRLHDTPFWSLPMFGNGPTLLAKKECSTGCYDFFPTTVRAVISAVGLSNSFFWSDRRSLSLSLSIWNFEFAQIPGAISFFYS